jgi:exodeoxyribonuclease-3
MFEYKLAWFERLIDRVQVLIDSGHPFVIAGNYNVVLTD